MVSRRTLLAVAAMLGACSQHDTTQARGEVLHGRFWPGGQADWRLALPDDQPQALLVALHGKGGNADSAFDLGFQRHLRGTGLALVSVSDFRRHNVFTHLRALRGIPVRIACGTGDPFIAANRELVARRPATGHTFDDGGHDDAYWSSHAGELIRWLAGRR